MNQKNQLKAHRWSVGLLLSVLAPTLSLAFAKNSNFNGLDLGLSFLTGLMLVGAFRIFANLRGGLKKFKHG